METNPTPFAAQKRRLSARMTLKQTMMAHPYRLLACVYALSVAAHALIILATTILPSIMDDEMLYMQLARSLSAGEGILVRGQAIQYPYVLYPLLIAPLYALPDTVNAYHAVLLFNTLSIHLMIFPAYALSCSLTGKKGVSLFVACAVVLMPDMIMAKHIMVESVAYPLLLFTLWRMLKCLREPGRIGRDALLGVLCTLLYALKPGYIALGIAYALSALIFGLREKKHALTRSALITAGMMALCVGVYFALSQRLWLSGAPEQSVYEAQAGALSFQHLVQAAVGTVKYIAYAAVAFGFLPLAALVSGLKRFQNEKRVFAYVVLTAFLLLMAGTAYVIYYDEYVKTAACLRGCISAMCPFCCRYAPQ